MAKDIKAKKPAPKQSRFVCEDMDEMVITKKGPPAKKDKPKLNNGQTKEGLTPHQPTPHVSKAKDEEERNETRMPNFWKIIAGSGNRYIEDFETKKCIAIGWAEIGDLSEARSEDDVQKRFDKAYPDEPPGKRGIALGSITKFRCRMHRGDNVISYNPGTREYLWGEIVGDYIYKPALIEEHPHVRGVKWTHRISRDDLSRATRNSLTVLVTIIQPNSMVLQELQSIIAGQKPSQDQEEATDGELLFRNQMEKAHELIKDRLTGLGWDDMQELFASILRAMGYKTAVSPVGPDKGKDVIASPDGLGLEEPRIKAEIKHRKQQMGAQEIRSFLGGLRPGDKGLYVSTGGFSREAEYEAERSNIPVTLIDLDKLAELLVQRYEQLDSEGRALIPLARVFWPTS